ncbi:MAG: bi-domain-containing oxidoreductase [Candidatus Aminicenantales bacterium]
MRQILQNQKTGELSVQEVPSPSARKGGILVRNVCSLISAGTEKTSVETAQATLLGKAKSRPDLVKQVLDNVKKEGVLATYGKVRSRLEQDKPLGYSSAGLVIESGCEEFQAGDRVACAGAGYASHAEVIWVPRNLAAGIPEGVDFDDAAFATLGAIALQGVRQADVRIGENVAVIGLGLIGLLTLQILKAAGCRVLGLDISFASLEMARELGADLVEESDPGKALMAAEAMTSGVGVDAVIITASTKSNEPVEISGAICRDRGRVVIVGAVKTDVPRSPFYEKEITILMSRSYGPGRYDYRYEEKGHDYPIGYVRWTEQRNMAAFLDLLAGKKVDVKKLITHRFPLEEGLRAYDVILGRTQEKAFGVLLDYPAEKSAEKSKGKSQAAAVREFRPGKERVRVGFIGAGNFAQSYLLPNLKKNDGVELKVVVDGSPLAAKSAAGKFGFETASSDGADILENGDIDAVFIATSHDSHGPLVLSALRSGKKTYVEKPLAVRDDEVDEIAGFVKDNPASFLMVGFNRRFSRPVRLIKESFDRNDLPLIMNYRVNAGPLAKEHWLRDPGQGGRIVGEGCHFIDVMAFIAGSEVESVFARSIRHGGRNVIESDNVTSVLRFRNGSIGSMSYFATGDPRFPKEQLEVFGGGKAAVLDDNRRLRISRQGKGKKFKFDGGKGHREEMDAVIAAMLKGEESPIPFKHILNTTRVTLAVIRSLETGMVQEIS